MDLPVHSTNGKGRPFVPIRNSGSIRNLVFSACLNSTFVGDWLALKACICELDTVHGNLDHWLSSTSALKVVFGGAESHETNPQETQRRI